MRWAQAELAHSGGRVTILELAWPTLARKSTVQQGRLLDLLRTSTGNFERTPFALEWEGHVYYIDGP